MLRLISLRPTAQQDVAVAQKTIASSISTEEAVNFSADYDKILLAKGGPDVLLKRASSVLDASGEVVALSDNLKGSIVAMQSLRASRGQRVLLLARPEIPEVVKTCREGRHSLLHGHWVTCSSLLKLSLASVVLSFRKRRCDMMTSTRSSCQFTTRMPTPMLVLRTLSRFRDLI